MKFSTKAIHAGQEPDPSTGAIMTPIFQTSTYAQNGLGGHKGYEYSRSGNPTRTALEDCIAALENGQYGMAFASGLAAEQGILSLLKTGDHMIACDDLYGGSYRIFERILSRYQIETSYVPAANVQDYEKAIRPNTKLIWLETPTNPLLRLVDIRAIAEIAHRHNILLVVDNTFSSPYFQLPLELGADIVLHSTTKYINGHSDVVGGAVVVKDQSVYEAIKFYQNAAGGIPGPFDSWLTLRGIKTLAVRMKQHQENAFAVARFLSDHPRVEKVYYPGLPSHPDHELAKRQMSGFGGMVSFTFKGSLEDVDQIVRRLKVITFAESLGGIESLLCHPASMTHGSIPREIREARGVDDTLLRLSVGIEDVEDILNDLDQALATRPEIDQDIQEQQLVHK
ncbi:cystathionine gamma-synthase [Dictyobacter vulcani]|uniref:Cystathionine gamma-synthase n=1 Tax=Dictyobacter vulcani TaxID=2607529 RepID=A0A5J4KPW1_9CHLR|nr:cystathionine gamma-synthase [Dictyobacter vulcani]GER88450.1 cystathionine gamma-synthase [Dictyobacter vulcani]